MVVITPRKKVLVTSALPYVNNIPHIGNLVGCVLSADVFARFQRSAGRDVLYICGADEHGTTTEAKAREEGVSPLEICDKYYAIHKEIYEWFGIAFDHFGRTSAENHKERTQEIFKQLDQHGYVVEETREQLYSNGMFLSDRYVEGTCPHCGYEKARGDQCDGCGKLLDPLELKDPVSTIDGSTPEVRETTHLFLDLPALQDELEHWVGAQSELGAWTENAVTTTRGWFKRGLERRAITRDLSWGVPVPKSGYEEKVFYVWFDAPIGYISMTEQLVGDSWTEWWKNPDGVELWQFMGKDNVPFHTILFPASLLGSGEGWTLPYHVDSTEFLNYEDAKFSKSNGVGVFGDDARDSGVPADVWRYYLLINRPETADTRFQWGDFQEKLNNELVANLGNLVNRVVTFLKKHRADKQGLCEENLVFWQHIQEEEQVVTDLLDESRLKEALKKVMAIAHEGNRYFQSQEPWRLVKEAPEEASETLFVLANLVKDLAIMTEPFMPATSAKIFRQLGLEPRTWEALGALDVEGAEGEPELLFEKLPDEELDSLRARFAGKFGAEKLDLRVARIESVEEHPKADKLYIEHLDVGPLGKRTIVSGLVGHYEPEELEGRNVVLVANLKPAKLRGVKSEGMLLAAESDGTVEVLEPAGTPGDAVRLQGVKPAPAEEVTIDDLFSLKLGVKEHVPRIEGKALLTSEPLRTRLAEGTLS